MSACRRKFAALALLALALALAGCGRSADFSTTDTTGSQQEVKADVTPAQIEKYELGSAERTVLEWWRDLQLNDPKDARLLYVTPPALADLAGQFNVVAGQFDGRVKVVSSSEEGGVTTVKASWTPQSGKPQQVTLVLEQEGNAWRLDEPPFVDLMVARLQSEQKE